MASQGAKLSFDTEKVAFVSNAEVQTEIYGNIGVAEGQVVNVSGHLSEVGGQFVGRHLSTV